MISWNQSWLKDLSKLNLEEVNQSPILKALNDSFNTFGTLMSKSLDTAKQDTIQTSITQNGKDEQVIYKTIIPALDFDIANTFPAEKPKDDDVYWKRHNDQVDAALERKKEIIIKSIEVAGDVVKGIINPINVSTIDVGKILEGFSKK